MQRNLPVITPPFDAQLPIDPVCGMRVNPSQAKATWEYAGTTFYFCCPKCLTRFQESPEHYLARDKNAPDASHSPTHVAGHAGMQAAQPGKGQHPPTSKYFCPMCPEVAADTPGDCPVCGMALERNPAWHEPARGQLVYTCPMHPEIRQDTPGDCPKCGMALEPVTLAVQVDDEDPELRDMTRRLILGAALALPVFLLAMSHLLPGEQWSTVGESDASRWAQFLLSTPVVLWAGWPFFRRGWRSLWTGHLNMFTLISIGVGCAYVYSVFALLVPGWFPHDLQHGGKVAIYFEAAAVIVVLVLLGQVLEARARGRTSHAIRALMNLAPPTARKITANGDQVVPLHEVVPGDVLRIVPGERVPVDGTVIDGQTSVDESMVTGEPMPVDKQAGASVTGGTLNRNGTISMRAQRVGRDSVLGQIVEMVAQAQRSRAPIQALADRVAGYFVPAVILIAVLTFVLWLWLGPEPRLAYAIVNAVAVLIIACPCALGLATPMSIMVGIGRGAKEGVLVKNAEALERLEKVKAIVLDKTGTLTEGRPRLVDVIHWSENGSPATAQPDANALLQLAAALEQASEHPLASAITEAAIERGLDLSSVTQFQSTVGGGVAGIVEGKRVLIGNAQFIEASDVALHDQATRQVSELQSQGNTVMYVAIDGHLAGGLVVADPIRPTSRSAVAELKRMGLKVIMLTGDSQPAAAYIARQAGVDEFRAEMKPADKANVIDDLARQGLPVAMAGDGINDAPALAKAEVGIAMGSGTDVAIASAAITLMRADLQGVVQAMNLSRLMMSNIRQNLFFAFIYNALGVPIAAGILYPVAGLLLSPILAGAAMSFSSVSVIANALRLQKVKL